MRCTHRLTLALLLACTLAGCSAAPAPATGELAGELTIIGSSSVEPIAAVIADQFTLLHTAVTVSVQGPGSSTGIQSAHNGSADIGTSSRALKSAEQAYGLTETTLALDGIAVIVHPSNTVRELTREQLRALYSGEITNWQQLGGADEPVTLLVREAGSGTRDAFEELLGLMQDGVSQTHEATAVFGDSTNVISLHVQGIRGAIGYVSLGSLQPNTAPVRIDGVECTESTVQSGQYALSRRFLLLTPATPTPLAQAYVEYATSEAVRPLLEEEGLVSPR